MGLLIVIQHSFGVSPGSMPTDKMGKWREAYWHYFWSWPFALLPGNFSANALGNIPDIDCVDVTMYSKVTSGLWHSYKFTQILLKLTNIS